MSLPISRLLPAVALLLAAGAAAGDTPCWECRAAACYGIFKQTADQAWRRTEDEAMAMIVRGFIEPIARELPMEYALELNKLIEMNMEGSVG